MAKKMIKVTQIGSPIGRPAIQRATLKGLGLNKMGKTVELEDTPSIRGMVNKIPHLVKVEEQALQNEPQVAEFESLCTINVHGGLKFNNSRLIYQSPSMN